MKNPFEGDILRASLGFVLVAHFLDLLTTAVGLSLGHSESNPLVRHYAPQLVVGGMLLIKATLTAAEYATGKALKTFLPAWMASLPLLYSGIENFRAAGNNLLIILFR